MSVNAAFRPALMSVTKPMVIVIGLLLGVGPLGAQTAAAPTNSMEQQIAKVAADLQNWPKLKGLTPEQRRDTVTFVLGNMFYAVFHEMGHAVISEMQLPVLGREEDAADAFAILSGTKMMTNVSERALIEGAKGWFFNDLNDKKTGYMQAFYEFAWHEFAACLPDCMFHGRRRRREVQNSCGCDQVAGEPAEIMCRGLCDRNVVVGNSTGVPPSPA